MLINKNQEKSYFCIPLYCKPIIFKTFNIVIATLKGNTLWDMISQMLKKASEEQKKCHAPKPILVDSGEVKL